MRKLPCWACAAFAKLEDGDDLASKDKWRCCSGRDI